MKSIWSERESLPSREALTQSMSTDVAIIGGGMAGVLTALLLRRQGKQVVVLEARQVGGGQTRNTTAKLTSQHNLLYNRLIREQGVEKARQYARANQEAIALYRTLIAEYAIRCHLEDRPAYLYSTANRDALLAEAEAAVSLGLPASFVEHTALPFPVVGAVRMDGQAQFHPLEFLGEISRDIPIYEGTEVTRAEGNRLITSGGVVTANQVVFATHYPFPVLQGLYTARMHQERSYVVALENAWEPDGMYLGIDEDGLSLRSAGRLLLLGGGKHRTGENSGGGRYAQLEQRARQLWPSSKVAARWSAQDCMTLDGIPYIGKLCVTTPDWYVATGFNKWGMTGSMVAAMLLCDRLCGVENPNAPVFSPQRLGLGETARQELATNSVQAVKGISRRFFTPPRAALEQLPCGHGGVVDCDGDKVGVYKDERGDTFIVSLRCPHMGCQLEWNPDEKSWDCPCHGSRFDYRGRLLDNPAQEDLEHD